jgi:hypothetical protein
MSKDALSGARRVAPLAVDPAALPDDPAFLKQLVAQRFAELREKDRQLAKLEHHMHLLLKKVYGRSSEQLDPNQHLLFDLAAEPEEESAAKPEPPPQPELPVASPARPGHGRRRAPDTLERIPVVHDLTPAEKEALGGPENLIELPDEITEQWDWKPSCLFVIEHHQKKYVRQSGNGAAAEADSVKPADSFPTAPVIVAPKPPQAIPGGVAGPGLLAGYRGYVQADAYSGYDGVYLGSNGQILEVACWAHARRKFHDARRLDASAQVALARIGQLYALEKKLREQCATDCRELPRSEQIALVAAQRQEHARPMLASFEEWLTAEAPKLLPQNPVRQAMEYLRNHWPAFCRYTDDGRLDIDNNEAERAMKHIATGRKNWLFSASDRGARAAAIHFSLIATCRRHQVEPWAYLRDLLIRLPVLRDAGQLTPDNLRPLLPYLWRPA